MKITKKHFCILCLVFCLLVPNTIRAKEESAFQIYGDIFQFLPVLAASYSLAIRDYKGLGYLAIGVGSTLVVTYASKLAFAAIAKTHPDWAAISKRPDGTGYNGFPSGHTASAFSAAGFMQRRYGWKLGVPVTILAGLVGISRIYARRHTITQVIAGALLGYGLSYLFARRYNPNTVVSVDVDSRTLENGAVDNYMALSIYHRF
ncbi:phosphatase PAP2 family protein [Helicobacter mustelae]|uniref:PUtative PAP2 family protein n=1 Tax=Helicobacter mustelae (strain ATCC 43772 / CCUG 25715 / CIP 103759 / LMG 18044 / NCTC 12198 / R85-136P) TaxID=679897 RepID=D3UIX6_HELM1|nr:phosphatase PAP2 family protein [Helicobacter mustelae]CBG40451.1 PUtative PAP2 family protein [Helicobacter mustelae 12198]SQH71951.1 PAP2 family protein [Helicobacter mustelae]STP13092.1 PAP2 family protein [Helicobacter mustelae]